MDAIFKMTAAAIRAAKWREKQKESDPKFDQREAERKTKERAEINRIEEIEDTLKVNPTNQHNILFVIPDAPQGAGLIETGGIGPRQLDGADEDQAQGRVSPGGWGIGIETMGEEPPREYEDTFAPIFKKPRNVRLLHQFIYQNTKRSPMLVCLICHEQIGTAEHPGDIIENGFRHFKDRHPESFNILMGRINRTVCPEDHEGMAARHGGGEIKVQCRRCRKILYKPKRSDKN